MLWVLTGKAECMPSAKVFNDGGDITPVVITPVGITPHWITLAVIIQAGITLPSNATTQRLLGSLRSGGAGGEDGAGLRSLHVVTAASEDALVIIPQSLTEARLSLV